MFAVSDYVQMTGFKKEINLYLNGRYGRIRSICPVVVQMYHEDHITVQKELVVSLDCIHRCVRCAKCNRIHIEKVKCSNCAPPVEERQKRQKGLNLEEIRVYFQSFKDGLIEAEQYDRALHHLCPGTPEAWVLIYKAGLINADRAVAEISKLVKSGEINLLTFTRHWLDMHDDSVSSLHEIIMFFPDQRILYCTLFKALLENGETDFLSTAEETVNNALDKVAALIGDDVDRQLEMAQCLKAVLPDEMMDIHHEKIFDDILDKMDGPCLEVLSQCKRFRNESKITANHYDRMVMKWFGRLQTAHDRLSVAQQFMDGEQRLRIVDGVVEQMVELGPCKEFLAEGLITEIHYESVVSKWLEKVEGPALSALKQGKEMVAKGLITQTHYSGMVKKWLPHCF